MQTRIKICGLTRPQDIDEAVAAGADAIGLVFYPPSPRHVSLELAAVLARRVPPFVSIVGLFVNAEPEDVHRAMAAVPLHVLQFHGDEDETYCRQFARPYLRAARMRPGFDLLQYAAAFPTAQAILLDTFVEGYGGGGASFDWSLIPEALSCPLVLAGGLTADTVGEAVRRVRPAAVDVSSGVEVAKGIKDVERMRAFVAAVRSADAGVSRLAAVF